MKIPYIYALSLLCFTPAFSAKEALNCPPIDFETLQKLLKRDITGRLLKNNRATIGNLELMFSQAIDKIVEHITPGNKQILPEDSFTLKDEERIGHNRLLCLYEVKDKEDIFKTIVKISVSKIQRERSQKFYQQ